MSKDKKFSKFLKTSMGSPELITSPEFLHFIDKESKKRKLDPLLFFTKNKKYMKKLKH